MVMPMLRLRLITVMRASDANGRSMADNDADESMLLCSAIYARKVVRVAIAAWIVLLVVVALAAAFADCAQNVAEVANAYVYTAVC